jgi:hypothetical protein
VNGRVFQPLVRCRSGSNEDPADIGAPSNANRDSVLDLSELLTEVLKRDIEINEALK